MNFLDMTLAQLACDIPGATRVFHTYKLDFCCGGKISLAEAIQGRNYTAAQILADLEAISQQPDTATDWRTQEPTVLIDHIFNRYHQIHRVQLPELIRLAKRVEHVHGERQDCPNGLAALLATILDDLENHMQKEETILFPLLKDGQYAVARHPIRVMEQEHDDHGKNLEAIDQLTNDITPPPFACVTWRALYTGLIQFKEDLMAHIHLENHVLFPIAETASTPDSH